MKYKLLIAVLFIVIFTFSGCFNDDNASSDKPIISESITEVSVAETTTHPNDYEIITAPIIENPATENEAETTSVTEIISDESKESDLSDTDITTPTKEISQTKIAPEVAIPTETYTEEVATEPEPVTNPPEKEIEQEHSVEETAPPEPTVNIDFYVKYAMNFAESIGLKYDTSAIDCWDNPIAVTSSSQRVVSDIESRLSRYKNIEGFEYICIWYEEVGENEFEIYIGYA